jgi:excisionase family DNA binding protein
MTIGDLAYECGLNKHRACEIAREKIHAFARIHKGEAYGLTHTELALLRPIFLAERPAPRPPMLPGIEEDKPMMTVKEVAEALNVSDRTVRRHAAELGLTEDGKTTLLSDEDATKIKIAVERSGRNDLDNVVQVHW